MSKDLLFKLFSVAQKIGKIDEELIKFVDTHFSNKGPKIFEVIERGITKYYYKPSNRVVWIAMGDDCEHLIYPKIYCSCQDFYKSVVIERRRDYCKHLIAQIICEAINKYNELEFNDSEFKKQLDDLDLKI